MWAHVTVKYLTKLFQFVGYAPINVTTKNVKNNFVDNFLNLIPTTLTTLLSICTSSYLLYHPHFESYGTIHAIINLASLLTLTLIVIIANSMSFFNKSIHRNMNFQICQLERKMSTELGVKLEFHLAYILKFLVIFFLYFLSQGLVFYEAYLASKTSNGSVWSSVLTSSIRLIYTFAVLHVVLYSDIMSNSIKQLNLRIRTSTAYFVSQNKGELLKVVKVTHMNVWKILVQMNLYFGWSLLFIVVNAFVYNTYQLYWIFVTLQKNLDKLGVIEGAASLLYGLTSLYILINSCEAFSLEAKKLSENIERYVFWTSDNEKLHILKVEIFHQMNNLPLTVTAADFFQINRQLLGNVFASCCMYIVIFIQFFLASSESKTSQ